MQTDCTVIGADATCKEAVDRLRVGSSTCAIVNDGAGCPVGIITEQDVVNRIAFKAEPLAPVTQAMTAPVQTIHGDEFLFHAIAAMRRGDIRHLPVVDGNNALIGVLRLKDALFETTPKLMADIDTLAGDGGKAGLNAIKGGLGAIAGQMLDDGIPVPEIQALLSEVNNDVYRRITDLTLDDMAASGLGKAPVAFSVIIMGSGGRGENFIHPDQDNGLILADYPDEDHDRIDGWFMEFSQRLTLALDQAGFPLCRGAVMGTNPLWRKTISQWKAQFNIWVAARSVASLRFCDILFDFRSIWGEQALARELRHHVLGMISNTPSFLRDLADEAKAAGVALGFFDRFILVPDTDVHKGTLNLKQSGTLPLIEAVRIIALRDGVDALSTLGRMACLAETGYLAHDEHDYLVGAYQHLCWLIMRHQIGCARDGMEISYYMSPDELTRREKDMLVDGLKAIRQFRDRVQAELSGNIF
jgi:signal-transduction protein with cAMP-binding, CBS, and nucleotidyltransferase domain